MNIYTATEDYADCFNSMYKEFGGIKVLPKKYKSGVLTEKIDLLIFTGGEDVHPERYGSNHNPGSWINKERDAFEFQLMTDIFRGRIPVGKVLGICRGLQMMNVAFGGNLTFDITERYGKPHASTHAIQWHNNTPFSSVGMVNSMHHQCIDYLGDMSSRTILATEPVSGIIEAVLWADKYLAFQFHPEFMRYPFLEQQSIFASKTVEWCEGKTNIILREAPPKISRTKSSSPSTVDFVSWTADTSEHF